MNLADMLSYADIGQLSRIADSYQCECSSHSKHELIQSILHAVNRKGVFEQSLEKLTLGDIRFLNSILFDRRDAFSPEELLARARAADFEPQEQDQSREIIGKFKRYGWLFNGHSHDTKYLLQVPKDVKDKFCEALTRKFETELVRTGEPEVYREEFSLILQDIHQLLRFVRHEPVPLNAEGTMYKRAQQQLLSALSVEEELVQGKGWRFGYGRKFRDYPSRFSFLYDYCFYQDYLVEERDTLKLSALGEQQVLERKREDPEKVYRFWLRLYKGPIPNLQAIVHWMDRLSRTWVTCDSLKRVLCGFIKPFYYDEPENILEERILKMMLHLGMVRIGESGRHGTVVCMTKFGSALIGGTFVAEEDWIQLPV